MPDHFICYYGTTGILTKIWCRVNHLIKFFTIRCFIFEANLFKLIVEVVIPKWHRDIESASGQLLGINQNLAILFILILELVEKHLVHVILLFSEICVA